MSLLRQDMTIAEIVSSFPETAAVFAAHGLEKFTDSEVLRVLGPFLTLKTALRDRGVNVGLFLQLLEERIQEFGALQEKTLANLKEGQGSLSLLALLPCGLKVPFGKALENFMTPLQAASPKPIRYIVEGNLNQELSYYPYVNQLETLDELPDLILTADINSFYYKTFRDRFITPGHFIDVTDYPANSCFGDVQIQDPQHNYTMLTVNPLVIVADKQRCADRPLPRRWADILDPCWKRSITMRGDGSFFCHAILLPMYKNLGAEGVTALGKNVFNGWHPAQMVKEAGNGREEGAALYLMPHFFAQKIPHKDKIEIIWPDDGAVVSPVTLLVKKERAEELKPITDFLTGRELATMFAGAYFPAVHPDVDNRVPDGKTFSWLGWDFCRENDIEAVNGTIDELFLPGWREGRE